MIITIAAAGQSNISNSPAFDWLPPSNLLLWNASYLQPGSALVAPNPSTFPVSLAFAAEVASARPNDEIHVINVGRGSQPIEQWLPGAPVNNSRTDMYAALKAAVEAYLLATGKTEIDTLLWWQGESDWVASQGAGYVNDWQAVHTRLCAETWFKTQTSVVIMGVSSHNGDMSRMNHLLKQAADIDPTNRTFCDTSSLDPALWDAALLHTTGEGNAEAGKLAYRAFLSRPPVNSAKWRTVTTDGTRTVTNTVALAADPELRCSIRAGGAYRMRFGILAISTAAAGLRWGFSGPSATVITCKAQAVTPGSDPVIWMQSGGAAYPTQRVVAANGYVWLDIDLFITNITGEGEVVFNWAQATSSANATRIMAASYLDVIEL